ncbi:ribosomal protein S6 kinase-like 1 [Dendronephthya gigantea]|uniref:ribosomal protein S6 kinase-like 1 n=1 Tax=Dendronephthya gigantea TaxID=151771 RepID=UPI00106C1EF2|nr:ribosomal protein S6 kinase-like 1 [Dendronephthya gigantea]
MNEVEDNSWVREFDVSNPQKTHAGYTVYRVSSKVYPKGSPEGASEIIVFKRYSEIRGLYKELKTIYENKNDKKKKFPRFAKGHYFDRFDESVIEERQKQALSLLLFAGNISFLFTSEPFVKFFEGGVEHSSRGSSYSDSEPTELAFDVSSETEPWTPEVYFNEKQNSSDEDETIYEIRRDLANTDLSLDMKKTSDVDEKAWLFRAMSMCSDGEDIEALASEAGYIADDVKENSLITKEDVSDATGIRKTDVLPSQGSVDMLPTLLESDDGEEEVFVEILSPKRISTPASSDTQSPFDSCVDEEPGLIDETKCVNSQPLDRKLDSASSSQDNIDTLEQDSNFISPSRKLNDREDEDKEATSNGEDRDHMQDLKESGLDNESGSVECKNQGHRQVGRTVSNIAMAWIDPKKKDYLYQAAQIIQQALYCEANEMYEDAFNKYKICVGILLNGVQHDNDGKRREAVRRKTAQYLVKAEFLFNTYLKHDDNNTSDWSTEPQNSVQDITDRSIVDRKFGHLTLAGLKVIGVVGKNMLVECAGLDGVFVMKALHKTNAVHRSSRQEHKQTSRSFSKKYVRSNHMVKLHRHFDTNNSIFLLLEYAPGGCLWGHVKTLRQHYSPCNEMSDRNVALSNDTFAHNEHHSDVDESAEEETAPECTSVSGEDGTSKEIVGNELGVEEISRNSQGNSINSASEPFRENVSLNNDTGKETATNANCLPEERTCLKPGKTSVEQSGQPCQITRSDVLGSLDHVASDRSAMDKCVQYWIADLLLAINSLHSCGIILKDLKPSNVLLDGNGRVKLSYFGVWEEVDRSVDPEAVTQFYCAPEISRGEKITFATDWWSLGVLSYELITGKTLFSTHPWGIYPHSSIVFPVQEISTEARSFLSGLICHNSRERLGSAMDGVEGIKSHAFFNGVDWNELSKSR